MGNGMNNGVLFKKFIENEESDAVEGFALERFRPTKGKVVAERKIEGKEEQLIITLETEAPDRGNANKNGTYESFVFPRAILGRFKNSRKNSRLAGKNVSIAPDSLHWSFRGKTYRIGRYRATITKIGH